MIEALFSRLAPLVGKSGAFLVGVIICVALLIVLIGGPYWLGWSHRADKADEEQAAAALQAAKNAQAAEREAEQRMSAIEREYQEDLANVQNDAASTIADLHAGNLRLRQRLAAVPVSCPAASAPGSGSAAPQELRSADASVPAGTVGLTDADAEFLLKIASEADAVAAQLDTCSRITALDRQAVAGAGS